MKLSSWILALSCLILLPLGSLIGSEENNEPVKAELIAKENSIKPGQPFWVAVKLEMAEGWDTYWINPGDSGFPTEVVWQLPEGFKAGPIHWPYPQRFDNNSLVAFGYTDTALLLTEITPPADLKEGQQVNLKAEVNWLACKESCVPGSASLSLELPIAQATPETSVHNDEFTLAHQLLPKNAKDFSSDLAVKRKKGSITLHFKPFLEAFGEIENLTFIPADREIIDYNTPQTLSKKTDGSFVLHVQHLDSAAKAPVKGLLLVSEKNVVVKKAIHVDSSTTSQGATALSMMLIALSFAFLGGMILNVMPCVLPVIALKIFSFVKMADQKRRYIIQHGFFFSIGVILSFWALSGLLLILRAYGEGVGWGFQLQEPAFVAILASVLFILGLSLFGLFEMGTSLISLGSKTAGKSPLMSSFMSGVLATLVATPCTGPLLGPAVGFAMTLPSLQALLIFTFVGLGMAFPYLFFSFFPKLIRLLPKPGHWMETFKQIMGFMMMATVLWLLWVFTAQTDMVALFALLGALMVMAIAAWVYGKWATPMRKKLTRRIATGLALVMVSLSGFYALQIARHSSNLVTDQGGSAYSPENVRALREEGKTVFVDFTAKWCLICQANKMVLHSAEIQSLFQERGVVFLEADWTKRDSMITAELAKLDRRGVPVYAIYPADVTKKPVILPQTLTTKIVSDYTIEAVQNTLVKND